MKKIVRKIGSSIGITFNKEEAKTHNIDIGDVVDLSDITVKKHTKKKKK